MSENLVLAEGKTKIIYKIPGTNNVAIESKDDITAGDGVKRNIIKNKGVLSNKTTSDCFKLLNKKGVPTHFIKQLDERTFLAHRVRMIPIELVARRIATGSFLKRNPETEEGSVFEELVVEFFFKDDANHDPMMLWDKEKQCFKIYNAKKPLTEDGFKYLPKNIPLIPKDLSEIDKLSEILRDVFLIL